MTEEERLKRMQLLREKIASQIGNTPSTLGGMFRTDANRSLEDILRENGRLSPILEETLRGDRADPFPAEMPKGLTPEQQHKWDWEWNRKMYPTWAKQKIGTI